MVDGLVLPLDGGRLAGGGTGENEAGDGRDVEADAGVDTDAWEVLARLPGDGAGPSAMADSGVFEGSAFFVVRYGSVLETLLLARDSVGWSLRLLQRVDGED